MAPDDFDGAADKTEAWKNGGLTSMSTLVREPLAVPKPTVFAFLPDFEARLPAVIVPRVNRYALAVEQAERLRAEHSVANDPRRDLGTFDRWVARLYPDGAVAIPALALPAALVLAGLSAAFVAPLPEAFIAQQVGLFAALGTWYRLSIAGARIQVGNQRAPVSHPPATADTDDALTNRTNRVASIVGAVRDGVLPDKPLTELRDLLRDASFDERLDIAAVLEHHVLAVKRVHPGETELARITQLAALGLAT